MNEFRMPQLKAGTHCLRPLTAGDEALYCTLYGSAETMSRIGAPQDAATAARSFRAALRMNAEAPLRQGYWVIYEPADGVALGLAGLILDADGGAEVGVVLPAAQQGRGHATRAIAALADHAFAAMDIVRLHTRHDAGHASAAGLMQALGFECIAADGGEKGWLWQLTPARWASWPGRQGRANPLTSPVLPDHGRPGHD